MSKNETTSEEYILELRKIATGFTGIDPRAGMVVKPIKELSEEDTSRFVEELFNSRKTGNK